MSIGVTAASGRLGRAVLEQLAHLSPQADVIALVRDPERAALRGVEVRRADYAEPAECARALDGIDTVLIISAPVVAGSDTLELHRQVVGAATDAGVRRLVFTSIIGNERSAGTLYGETQQRNRDTEAALAESGLSWTVGRSGLYLDLDLKHIVRANETGIYRNNGGDGRCGYISIRELAFGFARLLLDDRHAGAVYNLVGEGYTQAEIVDCANRVFGLNVRYEPITVAQNIERMMADPGIAARGEQVARMLTGAFECIANGAFDVPSDFAAAAGRPARSLEAQLTEIKEAQS